MSNPVVVIGAGISGLTAVKSCLEEGLQVVCYDGSDNIGGVWNYRDDTGQSCAKSTYLNASKEWMAFSDFPVPPEFPNYMKNDRYLQYLHMYADKFRLWPHIRLETEVRHVSKHANYNATGQWEVTVKPKHGTNDQAEEKVVASGVMVCTGVFTEPCIPQLPGLDQFRGRVMHSSEYRTSAGLEKKNVLVVGSGNSAVDGAVDVGRVASNVYFVMRNVLLMHRIGKNGYPLDMVFVKRHLLWSSQFMSTITFVKTCIGLVGLQIDRELYNLSPQGFRLGDNIEVINDELPLSIITGSVKIKGRVHRFTPDGVVFEGETHRTYPLDVALFATGYRLPSDRALIDAQAVPPKFIYHRLYRRVFPVDLPHPSLAFIGCIKFNGATGPCFELQSRWVARVFSRKMSLPSVSQMEVDLAQYDRLMAEHPSEQKLGVVEFYPYIDQLAAEFGAMPNLFRLFWSDPRLWYALWFGPMLAPTYRLVGPHAWPGARHAILSVHERIRAPFRTKHDAVSVGAKKGSIWWTMLKLSPLVAVTAYVTGRALNRGDSLSTLIGHFKLSW